MPFPNHGGSITHLLKHFWKSGLITIKFIPIHSKTINVTVFSRKNHRSAWPTDGVGTKIISKNGPFIGNPINVWGRCQLTDGMAKSTNSLRRMVIGHDVYNIWTLRCLIFFFRLRIGLTGLKHTDKQKTEE